MALSSQSRIQLNDSGSSPGASSGKTWSKPVSSVGVQEAPEAEGSLAGDDPVARLHLDHGVRRDRTGRDAVGAAHILDETLRRGELVVRRGLAAFGHEGDRRIVRGEDDERRLAVADIEREIPLLDDDQHELRGEPGDLRDGGVLLGERDREGLHHGIPSRRRERRLVGRRQRAADSLPGGRVLPELEFGVAPLRHDGGAGQRDQGNPEQGVNNPEGRPVHGALLRSIERGRAAREPGGVTPGPEPQHSGARSPKQ